MLSQDTSAPAILPKARRLQSCGRCTVVYPEKGLPPGGGPSGPLASFWGQISSAQRKRRGSPPRGGDLSARLNLPLGARERCPAPREAAASRCRTHPG